MIVFNLLFLIASQVLAPLNPLPPAAMLCFPLVEPFLSQKQSLFELLNLPRRYQQSQLKVSIRDANKEYHPDKGGSAESFQRIRSAKRILSYPKANPYDTLGIQAFPSDKQNDIDFQIANSQKVYYIEVGMFYIISLVFFLAVTKQLQHRHLRKYLLLILVVSCLSQMYAFTNPLAPTILDFVFPKMPLHRQFVVMRNICSIVGVIIISTHQRRQTQQKSLIKSLYFPNSHAQLVSSIHSLEAIYDDKLKLREAHSKTLISKLRGYMTKALFVIFIIMVVMSVIN